MISNPAIIRPAKASAIEEFVLQKELRHSASIKTIRTLIWIYFYLVIFEGALRKWVLPGLATPLLVIRDPFALWAIYLAWNKGLIKANGYLTSILAIGIISFITAITLGHGNVPVALFGFRIYAIHFPLMFVMAAVLDREDVIRFGNVILVISVFMAVLIGLQFFSPQSAWVNRGVGGDETGAGFSGAMGYLRPPGTFSFTIGTTIFFHLVAAYVFYFWLNTKETNKLLLILATIALLSSIPLSISRSLFFSVIICAGFAVISSASRPRLFGSVIGASVGIFILLGILSQTDFFSTATAAFSQRLDQATEGEGGYQGLLVDRYLGGLASAILNSYEFPFFGYGTGLGTNVGGLLATGKTSRVFAEGDWGRIIAEQGLLLGLLVIIIRVTFCGDLLIRSWRKIKQGDVLPWMLLGFGLLYVPQGQWGQATVLGFSTVIGGLMLAAFNDTQTQN